MRFVTLCLMCFVSGCGLQEPVGFADDVRQAVKEDLVGLGAKVTAEDEEVIYLSLRNTHLQVRELSIHVDGATGKRKDWQDFIEVGRTIGRQLMGTGDNQAFEAWFQEVSASRTGRIAHQAEYETFNVTVSRRPLFLLFTRKQLKTEDEL